MCRRDTSIWANLKLKQLLPNRRWHRCWWRSRDVILHAKADPNCNTLTKWRGLERWSPTRSTCREYLAMSNIGSPKTFMVYESRHSWKFLPESPKTWQQNAMNMFILRRTGLLHSFCSSLFHLFASWLLHCVDRTARSSQSIGVGLNMCNGPVSTREESFRTCQDTKHQGQQKAGPQIKLQSLAISSWINVCWSDTRNILNACQCWENLQLRDKHLLFRCGINACVCWEPK